MDTHRQLVAWQRSRDLVRLVYRLTSGLPAAERFVTVPQLRRAAWSVHNNVAEGNAKFGRRELRRYVDTAIGSLAEIDAMLATPGELYPLDPALVSEITELRREINSRLFGMLRTRRQA